MARLGAEEIGAIEAAVNRMVGNLSADRSALNYTTEDRTLLGAKLGTEPSGYTDAALDVSAIRALYYPVSGSIMLTGKTWSTDKTPDAATLSAFRSWVIAALAHELCHLLQHRQSPEKFGLGSEAEEADALSRRAKCSGLPGHYVTYVGCALEMEAHATQLAAELRSLGELTSDAFGTAARGSSLVAHVKRKSTTAEGDVWPGWGDLEARLIGEAWIASEMMWGR